MKLMAELEKTWGYVLRRLVARLWSETRGVARRIAPSLFMGSAVMLAFMAGESHLSPWWMLGCMVLGGFAIGAAEDRAESRAATSWANKFWGLIESDHVVEVQVTHRDERTAHS